MDAGDDRTQRIPPTPSAGARPASSADPLGGAAWAPGTLLAGRYRLVGLLGRGGMGEVYRADDLTLGQSVALKFLPAALAADPDRRRRLFAEVRVAREISHPNVCRVYDVGEADGHAFLSMEFIDGENLASLLRRIGRLPQEKGVEIARQLCAGLAALHDRGVVHRDLKPANVMLDGRGRVRLTDFGLAALVDDVAGAEARAGTPAYMAPEQLRGEGFGARSDLFALGLVLYEIFTGKRAFAGDTPADIARQHRESTPRSPSTIHGDLDPAIESAIARCLEKEPSSRPSSAIAVAAALPGGDPLAAALAAGEIPSIEMVAAAGATGRVRPWVGALCCAAVVAAVVLAGTANRRARLHAWDPMEKPPAVLEDRAREILRGVGHDAPVEDTASGLAEELDVLRHLARTDSSASRWETLRDARPPGVVFWYRQSPRQIIPWNPGPSIDFDDPPSELAGMARVRLDTRGRLTLLDVVPPRDAPADSARAVDPASFDPLFRAAGLDRAAFRPTTPAWAPPRWADARAAWAGTYPEDSSIAITVEAASVGGKPTHFAIRGPWSRSESATAEPRTTADRVLEAVLVLGLFAIVAGGVVLGVRNARSGRGDRLGARRLALFSLACIAADWIVRSNHSPRLQDEVNYFFQSAGSMLLVAGFVWSLYLALEPWVRRTWPERIVGWSRVLTGRLRDPLVGRDILAGGVLFLAWIALRATQARILGWREAPPPPPDLGYAPAFLGASGAMASVFLVVLNAIFQPMFLLLLLVFLRGIFRNTRAAYVAFVVLFAWSGWWPAGPKVLGAAAGAISGAATLFVLVRFGLLAFIVGRFFLTLVDWFPVTFDASAWYAGSSTVAVVLVLATTAYGLRIAVAGRAAKRG